LIPASSNFLRAADAPCGPVFSRHARRSSVAFFCASRSRPGSSTVIGAPISSSIGCDRSSTALTPTCAVFAITSSTGIVRVPKLYGTFMPTWTPAHLESGFAAKAPSSTGSRPAAGTASISFPISRRV
jgi:hypothetical protein